MGEGGEGVKLVGKGVGHGIELVVKMMVLGEM